MLRRRLHLRYVALERTSKTARRVWRKETSCSSRRKCGSTCLVRKATLLLMQIRKKCGHAEDGVGALLLDPPGAAGAAQLLLLQ
jgi:hypothetical protein